MFPTQVSPDYSCHPRSKVTLILVTSMKHTEILRAQSYYWSYINLDYCCVLRWTANKLSKCKWVHNDITDISAHHREKKPSHTCALAGSKSALRQTRKQSDIQAGPKVVHCDLYVRFISERYCFSLEPGFVFPTAEFGCSKLYQVVSKILGQTYSLCWHVICKLLGSHQASPPLWPKKELTRDRLLPGGKRQAREANVAHVLSKLCDSLTDSWPKAVPTCSKENSSYPESRPTSKMTNTHLGSEKKLQRWSWPKQCWCIA